MRLNETTDEFKNIKSNSVADRLKYTERRVQSLDHRLDIISANKNAFNHKIVKLQHVPLSHEDLKKGFTSFTSLYAHGKTCYAIYHSLSPRDIEMLSSLYKKLIQTTEIMDKLKKSASRLKREVKIENGTYVSPEQLNNYKNILHKKLADIVVATVGRDYSVYFGSTKTKQNGHTRLSIKIFNEELKETELTGSALTNWKNMIKRTKKELVDYLFKSGILAGLLTGTVRFNQSTMPVDSKWVVCSAGTFDVIVPTNKIIEKFKT